MKITYKNLLDAVRQAKRIDQELKLAQKDLKESRWRSDKKAWEANSRIAAALDRLNEEILEFGNDDN